MEQVIDTIGRSYVALIANIGLLALLGWVVTMLGRSLFPADDQPSAVVHSVIGMLFGIGAALLMNIPVEIEPGLFGDARGAPVLLAGIVGGPVAAAIAASIAGAMRLYLGGTGAVLGATYIAAFAVAGLAWRQIAHSRSLPSLDQTYLACITIATTSLTAPLIALLPESKQLAVLTKLWPQMLVGNLIGVAFLGTLIAREKARRAAETALRTQTALAEQAAEAKTKFLAAMSHEIRTPLNGILGILQLAQMRALPPQVKKELKIALDSGQFLTTLINQVLDFARIDAGQTVRTEQVFRFGALMDSMYSMFKHQADSKGIAFDIHAEGKLDQAISADFEHIRQILFNLIGNAIKFTQSGRVDFRGVLREKAGGHELVFSVSDTGPGIAGSDLERIFDEFQQGSAGRQFGGSGLGLSISAKLASALDGRLTCTSEIGLGSTFTLTVPATTVASSEAETKEPVADAGDLPSLNVLVAEDNSINQMVIRSLLEHMGQTVVIVSNGQEALDAVKQKGDQFDIVFMDIEMPVMNGHDATRLIRQQEPADRRIPIFALTANAFEDQHQQYLDVGVDGVLTKPLRAQDLWNALLRISRMSPPAEASRETGPDHDAECGAPSAPNIVDEERLKHLRSILPNDKLTDLLEAVRAQGQALANSLGDGSLSPEEVDRRAHDLKGVAANLGLCAVEALAAEIRETASDPASSLIEPAARLKSLIDRSVDRVLSSLGDREHESS